MAGHELIEMGAAMVLSIAGLLFVPLGAVIYGRRDRALAQAQPRLDNATASAALSHALVVIAAALSVGAAVIHFAAIPPHLEEFPPFAYAFGALAVTQLVLAVGLLRNWPHMRVINIVLSAGVVAVWILSRTAGLPVGPEPWQPEAIGFADVVATGFEAALIAVLAVGRVRLTSARPAPRWLAESVYLYLVPVSGVIGLLTLVAVASLGMETGMHMDG